LNLDFKKAQPFFVLRDKWVKYPEMKKMVGIMNMSMIMFRIPARLFFEGSSTIQTEDNMPLLS
jgi:hypothetical protein